MLVFTSNHSNIKTKKYTILVEQENKIHFILTRNLTQTSLSYIHIHTHSIDGTAIRLLFFLFKTSKDVNF